MNIEDFKETITEIRFQNLDGELYLIIKKNINERRFHCFDASGNPFFFASTFATIDEAICAFEAEPVFSALGEICFVASADFEISYLVDKYCLTKKIAGGIFSCFFETLDEAYEKAYGDYITTQDALKKTFQKLQDVQEQFLKMAQEEKEAYERHRL